MQFTRIDTLFAAKAISKEIDRRVKKLEDEVKAAFVDEYKSGGSDRKRSRIFGNKAGYLTIKEGKPSERVTKFQLVDVQEATDWMDAAKPDTDSFAQDNLELFCKWWFEHTGECPDGCTVINYDSEPGEPTAILTVKEKEVLPILVENGELPGEVNQLLFGEANQRMLGDGE